MNFFKSVFSGEEEEDAQDQQDAQDQDQEEAKEEESAASPVPVADVGSRWNFGVLMKSLATKSESVIETYRRDLEEFSSGLKKETEAIREVAAKAVRDLPTSLEAGASVAQESLESMGQAIDDFGGSVWRGTTGIIAQGKEAIVAMEAEEQHTSEPGSAIGNSKRYNRFEGQLMAIQADVKTFAEEPEVGEDFHKWKGEFDLGEKEEEIEALCYENGAVEGFMEKLVPGVIDYDTFWSRYYYRVHKLKQAEDARAKLVKRVIDREEEEDLSWDVDDDEEGVTEQENKSENSGEISDVKREVVEERIDEEVIDKEKEVVETAEKKMDAEEMKIEKLEAKEPEVEKEKIIDSAKAENTQAAGANLPSKLDDNAANENKNVVKNLSKDNDVPNSSSQPSTQDDEDLEWDEIEDLGELEEKKANDSNKSPVKVDLMKKLSAADEDDLSWDIEDDDESTKP